MRDVMEGSVARPRFYLVLLGVFAGVALILALAGLYGVMSYAVAQRTREIGIRTALGSTPSQVVNLVMRQGMGLVAVGTIVGLLGAFALTRLLGSLLYGVSPLDALTWLIVTVLLAGAAAAATFLPARRASNVEPLVAIRTD
jgi:ABC-type antimicrobial peptide transport system permease subunit